MNSQELDALIAEAVRDADLHPDEIPAIDLYLDQIISLMGYLNGDLTDESDDLVDDTLLFFLFVRLAARARYIGGGETWDDALVHVTEDYREPVPGAREKLIRVLKIMLTAWVAGCIKAEAERMIGEL